MASAAQPANPRRNSLITSYLATTPLSLHAVRVPEASWTSLDSVCCLDRKFCQGSLRRRYLICPEVLGDLGTFGPEDLREPYGWTSLTAMSAQTLSELAALRQLIEAQPPTLTLPNRLRFASAETLDAFTLELTEQLQRLVWKYHGETSGTPYRFVLSAYPVSPETIERESVPGTELEERR